MDRSVEVLKARQEELLTEKVVDWVEVYAIQDKIYKFEALELTKQQCVSRKQFEQFSDYLANIFQTNITDEKIAMKIIQQIKVFGFDEEE